nr:unnamed protein product [Digitaria exilis]
MDGEEIGRRGIPSLLKPSSGDGSAGEQERIASYITQLIGWTPLIELKRIASKDGVGVRIVGKMEAYQPLCSVKDRSALRFIAVMPAKYSLDKQILLRYMGAELYLTDPALGFPGMYDKVEQLQKELPNVHVLNQVTNKANSEAHFRLTGPEIWKDTAGKVDIFVAASGTGGTVSGGAPGKHKIQGVGPGFLPEVLDTSIIDEIVMVTTEEAMENARRLAKEEGLLVGISSGANLAACLKVASREENKGKMIVTVFPSGGERYINSDLFAYVREECLAMTF